MYSVEVQGIDASTPLVTVHHSEHARDDQTQHHNIRYPFEDIPRISEVSPVVK